MKNSVKNLLAVTVTVAVLGLTAPGARAQSNTNDFNIVTVALTLQSQGSISDDGTTRVYANPVKRKVSTKDLLNQLARDKYAQSNYTANFFPAGAKLALSGGAFVVVTRFNQFIVDVSDILKFSGGTNDIISGHVNDTTGLAKPQTTELTLVKLTFDDTFISGGGNLSFFVQGVDTVKTKDTTPVAGSYVEVTSDSVKNASGEGQSGGTAFIATGSIKGSRNVKLIF